jgi:hypothetical protein
MTSTGENVEKIELCVYTLLMGMQISVTIMQNI